MHEAYTSNIRTSPKSIASRGSSRLALEVAWETNGGSRRGKEMASQNADRMRFHYFPSPLPTFSSFPSSPVCSCRFLAVC